MVHRPRNSEPEYRLRVFFRRDERTLKPHAVVLIETLQEFVNFHYEILLEEERTGNAIHLKILGLHTPRSVMPGTGPARGFRIYPDLSGPCQVRVIRLDGESNEFGLDIRPGSILLTRQPDQAFVLFSSEPVPLS